jgi:hypothetical protein
MADSRQISTFQHQQLTCIHCHKQVTEVMRFVHIHVESRTLGKSVPQRARTQCHTNASASLLEFLFNGLESLVVDDVRQIVVKECFRTTQAQKCRTAVNAVDEATS